MGAERQAAKKKDLAEFISQVLIDRISWLPDLGSNQGPTD